MTESQRAITVACIILVILIVSWEIPTYNGIRNMSLLQNYEMHCQMSRLLTRGPMWPTKESFALVENAKDPLGLDLFERAKKRSDKVLRMWLGTKFSYLILDDEMTRYILSNGPDMFGPGTYKRNYFKPFMANNIGVVDFPKWVLNRPFVEDVLGHRQWGNAIHNLVLSKVENYMADFTKNPVVTGEMFDNLGVNAAYGIIFGEKFTMESHHKIVINMFKETQSNKLAVIGVDPINSGTRQRYLDFVSKVWSEPPTDSLLFNAKQLYSKSSKTLDVVDQIPHWFFPFRNILTVPIPIFLVLITAHLDIYEKLREEVYGEGTTDINYIHRIDTYLHRCVSECLRMYGIVTTMMRTVNYESVDVMGFKFKKGDQLMITTAGLTRSRKCFPDHNIFNPDRWLDDSLQTDGYCDTVGGFGKQSCPGMDLGKTLFKKVINDIMRSVDFKVLSPIISRDKLPHVINPWRIKIAFERKKLEGFGVGDFKI